MSVLSPRFSATLLPVADIVDGHPDWDGGWWILMVAGMALQRRR